MNNIGKRIYLMCIYVKGMISAYKDIGVSYISSNLQANGNEVILRYPLENEIDYSEISLFEPDYIGFTVYDVSRDAAINAAETIKKLIPDTKVCLGGYYATFNCKAILEKFPWVDYVIQGEGEITWIKLIQSLNNEKQLNQIKGLGYRYNGEILINEEIELIQDLNSLAYPDRSYLENDSNNIYQVLTARGCTSNCSFCSSRWFWRGWRGRNAADIAGELACIQKENEISMVIFLDSSFEDPDYKCNRLRSIAEEIINRNIHIVYYTNFRAEFYNKADDDLIDLLIRSGLRGVFIGIEAANKDDLELYRKKATIEDNINVIEFFESRGIPVDIGFINFNPYSNFEKLKENILYLKRFGFSINVYHMISRYLAYNCSDLYSRVEKDNLLCDKKTDIYNFEDIRVDFFWNYIQEYLNQLNVKTLGLLNQIKFYSFKYLFILSYVKEVIGINDKNNIIIAIEEAEKYNKKVCLEISDLFSNWYIEILEMVKNNENTEKFDSVSRRIISYEKIINYNNLLYRGKLKLSMILNKYGYIKLSKLILE